MLHGRWGGLGFGRVNPLVPAAVALAGLLCFLLGFRWIGAGVGVGAALSLVNGLLLSKRVDVAADTGDMGRALLIMQLGLLITFTVIAITTVILVQFSIAMAVSSAAGFAVAHLGMLAAFYWTRARTSSPLEGKTT